MKRLFASALTLGCALSLPILSLPLSGQRTVERLEKGWRFTRVDDPKASTEGYNDSKWSRVVVPHDWAIYGPFSFDNDKQHLASTQAVRVVSPSSGWAGTAVRFLSPRILGSVGSSYASMGR